MKRCTIINCLSLCVGVFVSARVVSVHAANHIWSWFQAHVNQLSTKCGDLEQQLQRLQSLADKIASYEQQLEEAQKEMSKFKQQTDERISQMETDHQNELKVQCKSSS